MQVLDLSRNDLEGIDSLLMVELPTGNDSSGGGGGGGVDTKGSQAAGGGGARKQLFPLENLQELKLNGNRLHGLPGDMAQALPSLVKLELYGNQIAEIRSPKDPLLRLKVRTRRCDAMCRTNVEPGGKAKLVAVRGEMLLLLLQKTANRLCFRDENVDAWRALGLLGVFLLVFLDSWRAEPRRSVAAGAHAFSSFFLV